MSMRYDPHAPYDDFDLYGRRLDCRELDPFYDERRLRRFVRTAWRYVGWGAGILALGGLCDLLGLIP